MQNKDRIKYYNSRATPPRSEGQGFPCNVMKNCNGCRYAEWEKTKAGRLHPSGDEKCTYKGVKSALPLLRHVIVWGATPIGQPLQPQYHGM